MFLGQRAINPMLDSSVRCVQRVGTLYLAPGDKYFGCRHCYNLSCESRNESRLARLGGIGYPIKAERQYEQLYEQIKRWTWRGRPTRKVRRLHKLNRKMGVLSAHASAMLDKLRGRVVS